MRYHVQKEADDSVADYAMGQKKYLTKTCLPYPFTLYDMRHIIFLYVLHYMKTVQ